MIARTHLIDTIQRALRRNPIVALLGPRQCGKTTLAREVAGGAARAYFDLEDPEDNQQLRQPKLALAPLKGLVVLDEMQRRPDIFPLLRVLADRRPMPARFLILGSATPDLIKGASESLAGRIHFIDMSGFTLAEVGEKKREQLWLRGGFPKSFVARTDADSNAWRENFIRTFLERDLSLMNVKLPAESMRRFWTMVAHYHGQIWNASDIGRSLGVTHHTANNYLDALAGTYIVRRLAPWHTNLGKRLVRSPKVYIRDSGLLHSLLRIPDRNGLLSHPKLGASWEGFALEHVLSIIGDRDVYFYATHAGAELDFVAVRNGARYGIEFKYGDAPAMSKSLHVALDDLSLRRICVVYPGSKEYALHEKADCVALERFDAWAKKMKIAK